MSKYLKKPVDSANFIAGGVLRMGTLIDDPVTVDGRNVQTDIASHSGAGAVTVNSAIVNLTTTGANALTLADGTDGQFITIVMITDGGDGTLTPANKVGFSTVTFNDVGDTATLLFTNSKWYLVANNGCTVA